MGGRPPGGTPCRIWPPRSPSSPEQAAGWAAPTQVQKRAEEWGPDELQRRLGQAFGAFLDGAPQWLSVDHGAGPEEVETVYRQMLEGDTSPDAGQVLSLTPGAFG
ncbi:MAG: DUF2855 family protein [Iamia sp.]